MIPSAVRHPTAKQAKFFAEVRQRHIAKFLCQGEPPGVEEILFPLQIAQRSIEARYENHRRNFDQNIFPTAGGAAAICFVIFVFLTHNSDFWPALILVGGVGLLALSTLIFATRDTGRYKRQYAAANQALLDVTPELDQVWAKWRGLREERHAVAKRIRAEHRDLIARAGGFDLYIVNWFHQETPAFYFETFAEVFSGDFAPYLAFLTRPVQTPEGERTLFECWVEEREEDREAGRLVSLKEVSERCAEEIVERHRQEKREEQEREGERKETALAVFEEHKDKDVARYLAARMVEGADE